MTQECYLAENQAKQEKYEVGQIYWVTIGDVKKCCTFIRTSKNLRDENNPLHIFSIVVNKEKIEKI